MELENRILLNENGRMFNENKTLRQENLKLKNRFQLFTLKLESLLDELRVEETEFQTGFEMGKVPRIFLTGEISETVQIKQGWLNFICINFRFSHVFNVCFWAILSILTKSA